MLNLDGNLFDAQEWLAGRPLFGRTVRKTPVPNPVWRLPDVRLTILANALARFHYAAGASTVGTDGDTPKSPQEALSLSRRLAETSSGAEGRNEVLLAGVRLRAAGEDRRIALRWLNLLPEGLALAGDTLRNYPGAADDASTLSHGDLWAPHVYFDWASFVGFVDFESLSFGSRTFDLAQLILHFNGWGSRDVVLGAYGKVLQFREEDRAVLPAAAIIDLAGEGYWSLDALYSENSAGLESCQSRAHRANLRALLRSLEALVANVF